jgi:hypothetical protein
LGRRRGGRVRRAVGAQERLQVELVGDVEHEPGEVVGWQPVAQVGWQEKRLVAVAAQEVVGHGALYLFALLEPNVLILTSPCAQTRGLGTPMIARRPGNLIGRLLLAGGLATARVPQSGGMHGTGHAV